MFEGQVYAALIARLVGGAQERMVDSFEDMTRQNMPEAEAAEQAMTRLRVSLAGMTYWLEQSHLPSKIRTYDD